MVLEGDAGMGLNKGELLSGGSFFGSNDIHEGGSHAARNPVTLSCVTGIAAQKILAPPYLKAFSAHRHRTASGVRPPGSILSLSPVQLIILIQQPFADADSALKTSMRSFVITVV